MLMCILQLLACILQCRGNPEKEGLISKLEFEQLGMKSEGIFSRKRLYKSETLSPKIQWMLGQLKFSGLTFIVVSEYKRM